MKINHVLIQTKDLMAMAEFLKQVIGLKEGYRPPFAFPGIWIYSEGKPIFHLVEVQSNTQQNEYLGTSEYQHGMGAIDHIALEGANYLTLIDRLNKFY